MDTELKEAIVIGIGIACLLWLVIGTTTETKKKSHKENNTMGSKRSEET